MKYIKPAALADENPLSGTVAASQNPLLFSHIESINVASTSQKARSAAWPF
jgi:hypothetical protein